MYQNSSPSPTLATTETVRWQWREIWINRLLQQQVAVNFWAANLKPFCKGTVKTTCSVAPMEELPPWKKTYASFNTNLYQVGHISSPKEGELQLIKGASGSTWSHLLNASTKLMQWFWHFDSKVTTKFASAKCSLSQSVIVYVCVCVCGNKSFVARMELTGLSKASSFK